MERQMQILIVMDKRGDSRHEFDFADPKSRADAERMFRKLAGDGYGAIAFSGDNSTGRRVDSLDPTATRTVFIPRLVGG